MIIDYLEKYLIKNNYKYEITKMDDVSEVQLSFGTKDFDILLLLKTYEKIKYLSIKSPLPFSVDEGKESVIIYALNELNDKENYGAFEYLSDHHLIIYRGGNYLTDSVEDFPLINNLFNVTYSLVDKLNDKIVLLAKGIIDLGEFMQSIRTDVYDD